MRGLRTRLEVLASAASAVSRTLRREVFRRGRLLWQRARNAGAQAGDVVAGAGGSKPADPHRRSGGLFRKYAALVVALVGGALTVNAIIEMYYSYLESQDALVAVQREKAASAAAAIEQFVKEIEAQLGLVAGFVPAADALEQRRFDFHRLLRHAPAITEIAHIDAEGREQIRLSRLAMDRIASGADLSQDPKYTEARTKKRYVSQVYFRKE